VQSKVRLSGNSFRTTASANPRKWYDVTEKLGSKSRKNSICSFTQEKYRFAEPSEIKAQRLNFGDHHEQVSVEMNKATLRLKRLISPLKRKKQLNGSCRPSYSSLLTSRRLPEIQSLFAEDANDNDSEDKTDDDALGSMPLDGGSPTALIGSPKEPANTACHKKRDSCHKYAQVHGKPHEPMKPKKEKSELDRILFMGEDDDDDDDDYCSPRTILDDLKLDYLGNGTKSRGMYSLRDMNLGAASDHVRGYRSRSVSKKR
jgi:hypothetical protein